jgi:hypothetical protein
MIAIFAPDFLATVIRSLPTTLVPWPNTSLHSGTSTALKYVKQRISKTARRNMEYSNEREQVRNNYSNDVSELLSQ